ncbi:MAG: hypothetical protein UY77_C0003G0001, partial [Candidatus Uhrbacteria bacterium GW2011_GWA2_53_10]
PRKPPLINPIPAARRCDIFAETICVTCLLVDNKNLDSILVFIYPILTFKELPQKTGPSGAPIGAKVDKSR